MRFQKQVNLSFCSFHFFCRIGIKNKLASKIACHNDNRIFKVYNASLSVSKPSVIKNLKQNVEYIGMRFFHFVKKNYAVRSAANRFCKLSSLIITDISRRRTDKTTYAEFFHIFRHIYAGKSLFVIEQKVCKRLCKFRFSNAGRSDKKKTSKRSVRVAQAGTVTADCIAYNLNGLILPDNALMQNFLQLQIFLFFA